MNVSLNLLYHRGKENIAIYFLEDDSLNNVVRKMKGVKWSEANRCWYLPLNETSYAAIVNVLKSMATIDDSLLKQYLQKKKQVKKTVISSVNSVRYNKKFIAPAMPVWELSKENLAALQKFIEQLLLKAYSASTIKTYRNEFLQLLRLLKGKPVFELTPDDLRRYMVFIMEKQGIRENTAHSRLNALKFYFEQVLGKEKFFLQIPRPKKPNQLPKLLNDEEIQKLFNSVLNKKHKAMLFTAYSAGLRVSEIINLKLKDIDSVRMQIFIERAKGKKDRYVNLSPVLLDVLRTYVKSYKPKFFLFESGATGMAYPARTVQQVFSNAKNKAGISKDVGIHSLRHSFATHLLDKGTDIRFIKDLLGHFDIRTTERYLHVSKKQLVNIISPFDDLWSRGKINW